MLSLNGESKQTIFYVQSNGFAHPGEKSICGFDVTGQIIRHGINNAREAKLHSGKKCTTISSISFCVKNGIIAIFSCTQPFLT